MRTLYEIGLEWKNTIDGGSSNGRKKYSNVGSDFDKGSLKSNLVEVLIFLAFFCLIFFDVFSGNAFRATRAYAALIVFAGTIFIKLICVLRNEKHGKPYAWDIEDLKSKGYTLSASFDPFVTALISLVYGYAWIYIFNGLVMLFSQGEYVLNFKMHALYALYIVVSNARSFYVIRKLMKMEKNEVQTESEINIDAVIPSDTLDEIHCPKCNHKFEIYLPQAEIGEQYSIICPECKLLMIIKK